jgi:hypothetical protein
VLARALSLRTLGTVLAEGLVAAMGPSHRAPTATVTGPAGVQGGPGARMGPPTTPTAVWVQGTWSLWARMWQVCVDWWVGAKPCQGLVFGGEARWMGGAVCVGLRCELCAGVWDGRLALDACCMS